MSIHCYNKEKSYNNKFELILKFKISTLKMHHSFYSKMFLQCVTDGGDTFLLVDIVNCDSRKKH